MVCSCKFAFRRNVGVLVALLASTPGGRALAAPAPPDNDPIRVECPHDIAASAEDIGERIPPMLPGGERAWTLRAAVQLANAQEGHDTSSCPLASTCCRSQDLAKEWAMGTPASGIWTSSAP